MDDFKQNLIQTILSNDPSARLVSGNREILMRCKYCPDSANINHAHMYVSTGYNDTPIYFYCQKCNTTGIVTHNRLIEWGIYDINIGAELINYNKEVMKLSKNRKFKNSCIYKLNNTFISNNELSEAKLRYINKRLGLNLSYNDLLDNKIVLNIKDLLYSNNINTLTRSEYAVNELNDMFLGFISQDNAFINMRNLCMGKTTCKSLNKRYINYNIFDKFDNTLRFYTIPSKIDLLNPNPVKIYIAEGPFDILSVKYNLIHNHDHAIFSAICGSSYLNAIKHFIVNMCLINIELHIYVDLGIPDHVIRFLRDQLFIFNINTYIHTNIYPGEKDMGVKKEKIKENIYKLI